jgi:hypothetical protein
MSRETKRELHGKATFTPKAKTCRMLGYSTLFNIKMKNTYKIIMDNAVYRRHDCYFKHYTEEPGLLNDDVHERHHEDYSIKEDENYDEKTLLEDTPNNYNLKERKRYDDKNLHTTKAHTVTGWQNNLCYTDSENDKRGE